MLVLPEARAESFAMEFSFCFTETPTTQKKRLRVPLQMFHVQTKRNTGTFAASSSPSRVLVPAGLPGCVSWMWWCLRLWCLQGRLLEVVLAIVWTTPIVQQ